MTILSVPKPTLQAINKPYMILIQMFHISGDLHEGQAYGITIACIEKKNLSVSVPFQMFPNQNTLNVRKLKVSVL